MVRYYDSSVLLAAILGQQLPETFTSLWDSAEKRLSSALLRIECLVGIRRAGVLQGESADGGWVEQRIAELGRYTDELDCKRPDDEIEEIIRRTPALSDCRTLDAVHIATALLFRPLFGEPITMVSVDKRMRKVAERMGFPIMPAS